MSSSGETPTPERDSTVAPEVAEESADGSADEGARRVKFPTALTVLAIVLLVVWVASFFIPSGRYQIDPETGSPIPGTYQELPGCGDVPEGTQCVDKSHRRAVPAPVARPTERSLRGGEHRDRLHQRR